MSVIKEKVLEILGNDLPEDLVDILGNFPKSENWPDGAESVDRYKVAVSLLSLMTGQMKRAILSRSTQIKVENPLTEEEISEVLTECRKLWNLHKIALGM